MKGEITFSDHTLISLPLKDGTEVILSANHAGDRWYTSLRVNSVVTRTHEWGEAQFAIEDLVMRACQQQFAPGATAKILPLLARATGR